MVWLIRKYPRIALALLVVTLLILLIGIIELVLKSYAPYYVATIGHRFSENSSKYGWGFFPHESLKIFNPDTGETYVSPTNNHGWRDKDRQYDNKNNAYRILVLGDSVTYGAIVPAHKVYTRILENKLQESGYNVEVINIAYGGWSTDQQLEALVNEGVKYNPNLIIVQFCTNDITGNAYFDYTVNKKENGWKDRVGNRPFYYELNQNNLLQRRENPYFRKLCKSEHKTLKERIIKTIIPYSEILKRLHAVYLHYRLREQTNNIDPDVSKDTELKYRVTNNQLVQLQTVIDLSEDSELYKFLHNRKGMRLSFEELTNAIELSKIYDKRNIIYRILEDRWFHRYWSINGFMPSYADADSYDWKLYFALISEIKKQASLIDADIAIFPETEEGYYQWSLSWHRVREDERSKTNFLSHIQVIKSTMEKNGVDVIDNTTPYQRARNDPHPCIEGNQSMADDIWKYLMLRKYELDEYKN